MNSQIEIVPIVPFDDGVEAGRRTSDKKLRSETRQTLRHKYLKDTLGAMGEAELRIYVMNRLQTPPDYSRYPELEDIYPERVDYLHGFAEGAGCDLATAATHQYVKYRLEIDSWWNSVQFELGPGHCSGAFMVGPDGVLGGQSVESAPPPKPHGYRPRPPKPYRGLKQIHGKPEQWVLRRPRTGYIEEWGFGNEKGVACFAGNSCSTHMDDPIEDTWPVNDFPLLRFATTTRHLEELYQRYTLHVWGRASQIWGDASGDGVVVEKSFRRVGFRRLNGGHALWCSEGHFESPEMNAFITSRRRLYFERTGRHLGCPDQQYFTDAHVRFTHMADLCHRDWGRGLEHVRRILTDHATFPRAICRHGGPDTAFYDTSVTLKSFILDVTHNRSYSRSWVPWKKFCCEVSEEVVQAPARP